MSRLFYLFFIYYDVASKAFSVSEEFKHGVAGRRPNTHDSPARDTTAERKRLRQIFLSSFFPLLFLFKRGVFGVYLVHDGKWDGWDSRKEKESKQASKSTKDVGVRGYGKERNAIEPPSRETLVIGPMYVGMYAWHTQPA